MGEGGYKQRSNAFKATPVSIRINFLVFASHEMLSIKSTSSAALLRFVTIGPFKLIAFDC